MYFFFSCPSAIRGCLWIDLEMRRWTMRLYRVVKNCDFIAFAVWCHSIVLWGYHFAKASRVQVCCLVYCVLILRWRKLVFFEASCTSDARAANLGSYNIDWCCCICPRDHVFPDSIILKMSCKIMGSLSDFLHWASNIWDKKVFTVH